MWFEKIRACDNEKKVLLTERGTFSATQAVNDMMAD